VPVVVVSGTDTSDLDPKDFAAILKKPIGPDTLVKTIWNDRLSIVTL
jgi:translation initiation factor 1 (eIF-1/SUI1)